MEESIYEKMRNKLTLFSMVLDTVMLDSNYADEDSILITAKDDLEELKEMINNLERKNDKR